MARQPTSSRRSVGTTTSRFATASRTRSTAATGRTASPGTRWTPSPPTARPWIRRAPPPAVRPAACPILDRAVRGTFSARRTQNIIKQKAVLVTAACAQERCTATGTGSLNVPRRPAASRRFRLKRARATLPAAARKTLRLRLSRRRFGARGLPDARAPASAPRSRSPSATPLATPPTGRSPSRRSGRRNGARPACPTIRAGRLEGQAAFQDPRSIRQAEPTWSRRRVAEGFDPLASGLDARRDHLHRGDVQGQGQGDLRRGIVRSRIRPASSTPASTQA